MESEMTLRDIFFLAKEKIDSKINYLTPMSENKYLARSQDKIGMVSYIMKVSHGELELIETR